MVIELITAALGLVPKAISGVLNRQALQKKKRENNYELLRENILQPLVHLYSKPLSYNYQIDRLKVHYDLSSLKKSPYYKETVEHLKLDIPDIPKPEDLENESNQLNSEVEDLENNLIPMWVSQTVSKKKQDSGI